MRLKGREVPSSVDREVQQLDLVAGSRDVIPGPMLLACNAQTGRVGLYRIGPVGIHVEIEPVTLVDESILIAIAMVVDEPPVAVLRLYVGILHTP